MELHPAERDSSQQNFFKNLPQDVLIIIMEFLPVEQLFNLKGIPGISLFYQGSKKESSSLLRLLLKKILNLKSCADNPQVLLDKVEKNWNKLPIVNLPFWGCKAQGGVLLNNVPFWVGKAFLKSRKPLFGFHNSKTAYALGQLSPDYFEFVQIVMGLSKVLKELLNSPNFSDDIDNTSLRFTIMHAFHMGQRLDTLEGAEEVKEALLNLKNRLYVYASKVHHFIIDATSQGGQDYTNSNMEKLPLQANIHEIELCRETEEMFSDIKENPIQTLLISTGPEITLPQLKKLMNTVDLPRFSKTNLTKDQYPESMSLGALNSRQTTDEMRYILFQQNERGLLAWVDMGSSNKVRLPLPFACRPWTEQVQVSGLRGASPHSGVGLTFGYISFRGILL